MIRHNHVLNQRLNPMSVPLLGCVIALGLKPRNEIDSRLDAVIIGVLRSNQPRLTLGDLSL